MFFFFDKIINDKVYPPLVLSPQGYFLGISYVIDFFVQKNDKSETKIVFRVCFLKRPLSKFNQDLILPYYDLKINNYFHFY